MLETNTFGETLPARMQPASVHAGNVWSEKRGSDAVRLVRERDAAWLAEVGQKPFQVIFEKQDNGLMKASIPIGASRIAVCERDGEEAERQVKALFFRLLSSSYGGEGGVGRATIPEVDTLFARRFE